MGKKFHFFVISLLYSISNIAIYFMWFEENSLVVSFFVYGFIAAFIYLFSRMYKNRRGVFFKLIFVSLCTLSGLLVLSVFPSLGYYPKIIYVLASSFGLYLLLLSVNIYIVSESSGEVIPLLQPAKSVVYTYQLATVFFSSIIIYKFSPFASDPVLSFAIQLLLFFVFYYLFFRSLRWFYMMEGALLNPETKIKTIARLSIFAWVFLTEISAILSFYPLEDFARAMLVAGVLFVVSNIINNYLIHKANSRMFIDGFLVLSFLYLLTNFL